MKYIKFINPLLIAILVLAMLSCDRDEIFEREQYKNVVALLSEDGFNIFSEELDISEDGVDGYIVASCGGSLATTSPIDINMVEDESLITKYNVSSYDTDAERYAIYLDHSRFSIENQTITIPAGERTGRMKMKIRTAGLSPDSIYFIPFRVNSYSAYEMNLNKSTVMYRIYLKNYYASTKSGSTSYSHRGIRGGTNTMLEKPVFPVADNEVRIFAGIKQFDANETLINKWALRVVVGEDNNVTILPWNNSEFGLQVTQVDGDEDYPNIFKIEDTGFKTFKTFLLRYDYVDPEDGKTYQMKEELRLEFNEREEE